MLRAGTQVWAWDSDAFGIGTPTGTATVNLRFPGQYFDSESDLHYNWNRYYNPTTGRYFTSDPIGLAGGVNTYLYAMANPVLYVDPEGLNSGGFGPADENLHDENCKNGQDSSPTCKGREGHTHAEECTPQSVCITISAHGGSLPGRTGTDIVDYRNGGKNPVDYKALAERIKKNPKYKADKENCIELYVCNAAMGGPNSAAAKLKKHLGPKDTVHAVEELVNIHRPAGGTCEITFSPPKKVSF